MHNLMAVALALSLLPTTALAGDVGQGSFEFGNRTSKERGLHSMAIRAAHDTSPIVTSIRVSNRDDDGATRLAANDHQPVVPGCIVAVTTHPVEMRATDNKDIARLRTETH